MDSEIIKCIKDLIKKQKIKKKHKIILFGYNNLAMEIMQYLHKNGFSINQVIDNNKKGTALYNIKITSPEDGLKHYSSNIIILVASSHYNEMRKQIIKINKKYIKSIIQVGNIENSFSLRNSIYMYITNIYNFYLLHFKYRYFAIKEKRKYLLLRKNLRLKNIHKGERCFILGNGPSLDRVNSSLLDNEIVFGVNQIMDTRIFDEIKIKYWVCTDFGFFGTTPDDVKKFYKKIRKLTGITEECFVLIDFLQYIKKYQLDEVLSFNYMKDCMKYDSLDCKMDLNQKIELDKFIFTGWSVVIYCIQIAIYMGFSEIYILGCDQTAPYYVMKEILEDSVQEYHASMAGGDECKKMLGNRLKNYGLKGLVHSCSIAGEQFGMLYRYCKKQNIRLVNLTEPSLLEELPKERLENIINNPSL